MYVVLWEFRVRPGAELSFERLYGPTGHWVTLFRTAPGYLGTELLRTHDGLARYVTVDRWSSAEAYAAFRHAASERYDALDRAGSLLTEAERCLGEFTEVAG